ncbi:Pex12 amino terminal region-domain-containing protein [Kockovaella imperatae]|uniref:Peroxisome assembly protein 12 n=1 Tax=Kockovaella imperatae TaxID=4999 RepID=A0A1Y1UIZ2_9TREE|nr:Pex12 amino terminal region-domain-containing protein [Kockovaella imperatae]ORX37527.1 Pex12 amino terminal region-domain-containing protein [Kockovaella imperatae]
MASNEDAGQPLFPDAGPSNPHRPSIFEFLGQDQLRDLFHPVIRYILSYFAQRYPRYLLRILNHHEEFFACVMLLIERHHLKKHNASVSEHFHQLYHVQATRYPRTHSSAFQRPGRLTRRQRWGLLVFLVGIPYLRARAHSYYEELGVGVNDRDSEISVLPRVSLPVPHRSHVQRAKLFKAIYPYLNLTLDATFLAYDLRYLFGASDVYRPWHAWLGTSIQRREQDEIEGSDSTWTRLVPPLLPPLLLALKLSQWWYSPSSPRDISLNFDTNIRSKIHRAIPPPKPLPILPQSGLLPQRSPPGSPPEMADPSATGPDLIYTVDDEMYGKCPLCNKNWQNPAILPSGWVVCWRCGWDAIAGTDDVDQSGGTSENTRRRGKCPFTGMDVSVGQLRRVLI